MGRIWNMILLKLFAVIALLLLLIGKKVHMSLALLISSLALLLICGQSVQTLVEALTVTAKDPVTVTMALTILLISSLGFLMDRFGMLTRMVSHLERLVRSAKITIALTPTLIGLLLVTGGALMSCPLVNELGQRLNLPNEKRAAINMLFRHGLYFAYPLSTTMILASQMGGFSVWTFIRYLAPLTIFIYALAWFLYLRGVPDVKGPQLNGREFWHHLAQFVLYASPILLSLLITIVTGWEFYVSLFIGIICAVAVYLFDVKLGRSLKLEDSLPRLLIKSANLKLVLIILAILLFKNTIGSIAEINDYIVGLVNRGIPLEIVLLVICLMITFPTGNFQPSLAVAFPFILPVAQSTNEIMLYSYILYCIGFLCYYASPLHLCQILSLEYFNVKAGSLYNAYRIFIPALVVFMILWYFPLRMMLR